jgi:hypothetical protein
MNLEHPGQVEQWDVFEIVLAGPSTGNPFLEVELTAQFTCGQQSLLVSGFYDGDGIYRVRCMPDIAGQWHFQTHSSAPNLDGIRGQFICKPSSGSNHGPVHVTDQYHFAYADGRPYRPVGTTCYVWQLQSEALQEQTLDALRSAPFNKLRFCVFPKHMAYNNNEPPYYPFMGNVQRDAEQAPPRWTPFGAALQPVDWDFTRFNPAYFRHLERRILDLQRLGIEADLILFHPYDGGYWGFDRMSPEANKRYLKYILARLSALRNVWWSFANEYDLMFAHTTEDWDNAFQFVQANDPYNHLRSIHNMLNFYDHRKPWVTHCSVQQADLTLMSKWRREYGKPVVVDECGYEGDIEEAWGNLSAQELVMRFWMGFTDGGYVGHGETYWNPEETLWWSKGGRLCGESVARIAFLLQILEEFPGKGLTPLTPTRITEFKDAGELRALFADPAAAAEIIDPFAAVLGGRPFDLVAGGHSGTDAYLIYFGSHQQRSKKLALPEGTFRIDVVDTWNMTIDTLMEAAIGLVKVALPVKPYLAIRILRI